MKKSFTLIETLVAISILTIGILGISYLISSQISSISYSENRLIAAYLAQEGIEIVRNIRDENWLSGANWISNLDTSGTSHSNFDHRSHKIPDEDNCSGKDYLQFDSSSNFYVCASSLPPNQLKREIKITYFGDVIKVEVMVSWKEKGKPQQYSVIEELYNWRK